MYIRSHAEKTPRRKRHVLASRDTIGKETCGLSALTKSRAVSMREWIPHQEILASKSCKSSEAPLFRCQEVFLHHRLAAAAGNRSKFGEKGY